MKEFEKMYKNSIFDKEPCHLLTGDPVNGGVLSRVLKEDIEYVWRAALEWTLGRIEYHYGLFLEGSDIVVDIEKELKEE